MIGISPEAASTFVLDAISVTREDIARAKSWVLTSEGSNTQGMCDDWLRQQGIAEPREVNTDAEDCKDVLGTLARAYSIRLGYYNALWELIASGIPVSCSSTGHWEPPLCYKTSRGGGGIPLKSLGCPYPERIYRLPNSGKPAADIDIFLNGIDQKSIHSGILEAIEQSLTCFRRGLYMPATVMLAAAAEATWTECGLAVARKVSNPKLEVSINDPYQSISRKIADIRKTLEQPSGKQLLRDAGQNTAKLDEAELWTSVLRDRRNALHWGKAKGFVADHAETAALLLGTPLHFATLGSIRIAC